MLHDTEYVLKKMAWMEEEAIWRNGRRYLWTDAFGLVLLVSLYREFRQQCFLDAAHRLVEDVDRVLGRPIGYRIGEAPDRDGQYYHYLAMWIFALGQLGSIEPQYHRKAVTIAKGIHPRFVVPGVGVIWKMKEDLSGMYPGFGLGALDAFHGYVVYSWLAPDELEDEILELKRLVDRSWRTLHIDQDLGLGMMLWMSHFHPEEPWATHQAEACLDTLHAMWIDPPGYFCRHPGLHTTRFAFTNYGVSLGLQAVCQCEDKVERLNQFFENYRSGDEYDREAITHVMACTSHFSGDFVIKGSSALGLSHDKADQGMR